MYIFMPKSYTFRNFDGMVGKFFLTDGVGLNNAIFYVIEISSDSPLKSLEHACKEACFGKF